MSISRNRGTAHSAMPTAPKVWIRIRPALSDRAAEAGISTSRVGLTQRETVSTAPWSMSGSRVVQSRTPVMRRENVAVFTAKEAVGREHRAQVVARDRAQRGALLGPLLLRRGLLGLAELGRLLDPGVDVPGGGEHEHADEEGRTPAPGAEGAVRGERAGRQEHGVGGRVCVDGFFPHRAPTGNHGHAGGPGLATGAGARGRTG